MKHDPTIRAWVTNRYHWIIYEKKKPDFYDVFQYHHVYTDKTFTELNNELDQSHPMTKFHISIVNYYKANELDPDIPWWEYNDPELEAIGDTFRNTIKH